MCFQANLERSLRGKTKTGGTARKLEQKGSKRQNIAESVGYNDYGGEMAGKVEFETTQGSASTIISVRWWSSETLIYLIPPKYCS